MDGIAARSGVSKRTLYSWHQDKSGLFRTCIVEGVYDLRLPKLDPALELGAALTAYGTAVLQAISTDFSMCMSRLLFRESSEFEEVRTALVTGGDIMSRPIADYFAARGASSEAALDLAELFMVATTAKVQKATIRQYPPPGPAECGRHLEMVVGLFERGIVTLLPSAR